MAVLFGPLSLDPNEQARWSIRAKACWTSTACEVFCGASSISLGLRWNALLQRLRHDPEYRVVAADARPDLLVVFLGVANLVKLRSRRQH